MMPKFDKTGPEGKGPQTGRGRGTCGGASQAGQGCRGKACGAGRGQGRNVSAKKDA